MTVGVPERYGRRTLLAGSVSDSCGSCGLDLDSTGAVRGGTGNCMRSLSALWRAPCPAGVGRQNGTVGVAVGAAWDWGRKTNTGSISGGLLSRKGCTSSPDVDGAREGRDPVPQGWYWHGAAAVR